MQLLYKKLFSVIVVATVAGLWVGCRKIDTPASFIPERVFTPTNIAVEGGETSARVSWNASLFSQGQHVTYKVELYDNQSFTGAPAYTVETDTIFITVTDADIAVRINYWARVKANATANSAESAGWAASTGSFRLTGEQFFLPVLTDYITDVSVQLRWRTNPDLTKIVLTPTGGGSVIEQTLSPADISAEEKMITGLAPSTNYTAEIFKETASKGIISFTTKSSTPTGANVINVGATDDLAALLAAAAPNTTFVLPQGALYGADDEVILPADASFTVWGEYGPNRPVIAFNGFRLPTVAGNIRFENIDFTGYQNNDPGGTRRNYIFNQSAANTTESVEFENCIIRNLTNTPFRLQGSNGQTINDLVFNKCTVYDIGDNGANGTYAFIHTNVAAGRINNIKITNSTLSKVGYSIILHNAAPSQSVLIEDCTFDNVVGDGRYFIDYNAQSAGSIQLTNIIIGKSLSPAGTARGIRSPTAPNASNSFEVVNTGFSANTIPGIILYGGANTDLFTDPANRDFLIKDANFAGKSTSGDPRWRL